MVRLLLSGSMLDRGFRLGSGLCAWVIAELFFKWHSFTLECAGFLATWLVLDGAVSALRTKLQVLQVSRSA